MAIGFLMFFWRDRPAVCSTGTRAGGSKRPLPQFLGRLLPAGFSTIESLSSRFFGLPDKDL